MRTLVTELTALDAGGLDSKGAMLAVNCEGYSTLSLQLAGTISAHEFTFEGSIDISTWVKVLLVNVISTGAALASGNVIASGIYRINCAGLRVVRLKPAASFAGAGLSAIMHCTEVPSVPVILT